MTGKVFLMPPVKIAIVGAGSRGLDCYGGYAEKHPEEFQVVAAAEPRLNFRREIAERHHIPAERQFKDWRELAALPKLADAVIIATNDDMHREPAIAFMEKGYHILLEKPMAPSAADCRAINEAAHKYGVLFAVCHVLRYSPYFVRLRNIVQSGAIGEIVTVRHLEKVCYWHQAHSFVRGNWRNSETTSPMILAKSCHDMDIMLFLLGRKCRKVSSFGNLNYFRPEKRPAGAADRCLDCPLCDSCIYSAKTFYLRKLYSGDHYWPLNVITRDFTEQGVLNALREGPYGRCVFACDNNVVDNQVVCMDFEGDVSASFTMTAFTPDGGRETEFMGTHGRVYGDGRYITVQRFGAEETVTYDTEVAGGMFSGGHGGGDQAMMHEFYEAITANDPSLLCSGPDISLMGHLMAFAAEESRITGKTITLS